MNWKQIFIIFVVVGCVASVVGYEGAQYVKEIQVQNNIGNGCQNSPACRWIAEQGVKVVVEDIPDSENGDIIRGQARSHVFSDGHQEVYEVAIDVAVPPEEFEAVAWHEAGHIWYQRNDPNNNDEAHADQFAIDHGYYSHDKYNGIH